MDPVTVIISALVAGAAAGLKEDAADAVKGAYSTLKQLLRRRFGAGDPAVEAAISAVEAGSDADTSPLRERLAASGVGEGDELTTTAQGLLDRLQANVTVTVTNSKGIIGVNQGSSVMNFSDGS